MSLQQAEEEQGEFHYLKHDLRFTKHVDERNQRRRHRYQPEDFQDEILSPSTLMIIINTLCVIMFIYYALFCIALTGVFIG